MALFKKKIPKEFFSSPGGMVLIFLALGFELLDLFLIGGSLTIEIILDLIFVIFLQQLAKVPLSDSILPFIIERLPLISDFLPTWLIRLFI